MSTSGNTIKTLTRDEIISAALRKLLVLGEGQSASLNQLNTGTEALNILVAEFRTLGMQSFLKSDVNVPLVVSQDTYMWGTGLDINLPFAEYIYDIQYIENNSLSKIPLNQYATYDFDTLPITTSGTPVNYNYMRGNNTGTLRIWPTPDNSLIAGSYLQVTYTRPMEVFDTGTDDYDCPQEWGNALIYNLAVALSDEYGSSDMKVARLQKQADAHLSIALSAANEQGSLFIQPDYRDWDSGFGAKY